MLNHPNGGAFGGREEPSVHIQAALGTLMTGRPVRIVFTREEVNFFTTKRHGMRLRYKLGAAKDGKIQAIQVQTVGDTGAYASSGAFVLFRACVFGAGCYAIPNACMDTYAVYTNNTTAGSMRGFGSTQPAVPLESLVDQLAEKLQIDPFEIRRINALAPGKHRPCDRLFVRLCGVSQRGGSAAEAGWAARALRPPQEGRLGRGVQHEKRRPWFRLSGQCLGADAPGEGWAV